MQTILDKAISLNEKVVQTNDEGHLVIHNEITRNDPISRNHYQVTYHSSISISIDQKTVQGNDERYADTHSEIEEKDPIKKNKYQDTNSFGHRYLAI